MSYEASTTELKSGVADTEPNSQVHSEVAPEPEAYLRLDTGEVIVVPADDATYLNNEFDKWNRLIYEQMLANEVLAVCDARLEAISSELAKKPNVPDPFLAQQEQDARKAQGWGIEWREQATEKLHGELKALDKLGDSGKKLIELIPVVRREQKTPYKTETKSDDWKKEGLDIKKAWSFKSGAGLRNRMMKKDRYWKPGGILNMNSGQIRKAWPKFKDEKSMKWAEVYKADKSGKRQIDRKKMREYLGEQVKKAASVKSKDFFKLEIENVGILGPEALEKWNANSLIEKEGELKAAGVKLGDIDFSAEAAAMRYFSGAGLSGEIAPLKGNVNIKAEGSAEIAFAEGKAGAKFYFPSNEGLLLTFYDLEQVSKLSKGQSPGNPYDLGAVRLMALAELSGVIGVSLAGEVSIGMEMKDVEVKDKNGKTIPAKVPQIKGSNKKVKRRNKADVNGKGAEWKQTAGLDAQVNFFAGARGGVELKGAIEWRNPHNAEKKFEPFASVAPKFDGMAGIAGEAKVSVEYIDGIFRISVHAGLCFGIGASGEVTLAVGLKQLASFSYWMFYTLGHAEFRTLKFIAEEPFEAWQAITYLVVCEGENIEKYFSKGIAVLRKTVNSWETKFTKADANIKLGQGIIDHPERVRFSPPEAKGMLIYQLTRFSVANWLEDGEGFGLGDDYLPTQRAAVIKILDQAQTKDDLKNIIQHIGPAGEKGNEQANAELLKRFFAAEGPHGLDIPFSRTRYQEQYQSIMRRLVDKDYVAMNGDFETWYDDKMASLQDSMVRGYPALDNSTLAYALQKDMGRDHPLFSSGDRGFYSELA
jgi:hypothetical protein